MLISQLFQVYYWSFIEFSFEYFFSIIQQKNQIQVIRLDSSKHFHGKALPQPYGFAELDICAKNQFWSYDSTMIKVHEACVNYWSTKTDESPLFG